MDESLWTIAYEVRWKTLKLLEDVTEEQAMYAAPGTRNTILWHAGHALTVVEALAVAPASGRAPEYPEGYKERFAWGSDPSKVTSWPALSEVVERLKAQRAQLKAALEPLTQEQLTQPFGDRGRPLRYAIIHGLHDEAVHSGEIFLLKKLYARRGGRVTGALIGRSARLR